MKDFAVGLSRNSLKSFELSVEKDLIESLTRRPSGVQSRLSSHIDRRQPDSSAHQPVVGQLPCLVSITAVPSALPSDESLRPRFPERSRSRNSGSDALQPAGLGECRVRRLSVRARCSGRDSPPSKPVSTTNSTSKSPSRPGRVRVVRGRPSRNLPSIT